MNNEELKPCPFCGGEAEIKRGEIWLYNGNQYDPMSWNGWIVSCKNCNHIEEGVEKSEAIAAWNSRNYSEKQDSSKELMDFVKFCQNASEGCIVYISNRARDLIAKHKECCKYAECKDGREINFPTIPKLTYADVEKMVKPLDWRYRRFEDRGVCEYAYINPTTAFKAVGCLGDCRFIFWDELGSVVDTFAIVEDGEKDLEVQKQNAQKFLVDLVADALGVERSGK